MEIWFIDYVISFGGPPQPTHFPTEAGHFAVSSQLDHGSHESLRPWHGPVACSPALRRPRERPLPYLNQNPGRAMEKNGLYYRVSYLGLYRVKQGTILMETVYDSCSIHVGNASLS